MLIIILTFFFFNNIVILGDMMYTKILIKMKTKFMNLSNEELINNIFSSNILISSLAKEELFNRDLSDLELSIDIINKLINKLSIEEIWYLANNNIDNRFIEQVKIKLNQLLDYYQNLNLSDFLKKKYEEKSKIFSLK